MNPKLLFASPLIAAAALAADAPVPVSKEPMHRVVFENAYVRMIDVRIPEDMTTRYHVHDIASVIVYLTNSTNRSQTWGEAGTTPRTLTPGESRYAAYDEKPLTHRVTNTGPGLFRVWDIELLRPVAALERAPKFLPPGVELQWEQKRVRSYRVRLKPNAQTEFPPSAAAYLVVSTDGAVTVRSDREPRRMLSHGDFEFIAANNRIRLSNPSREPSESVVLELK